MSGGFLGLSLAATTRRTPQQLARLDSVRSEILGPLCQRWGEVSPGQQRVVTWRRASGLGTQLADTETALRFTCGVAQPDRGGPPPSTFSAISSGSDGIRASCDLFGYRSLFVWQGRGIATVSTRPELVAAVIRAVDEPLTKRLDLAADLAYVGWLGPRHTGWNEVRALAAGESVELRDGVAVVHTSADAAAWCREPPPVSLDDVIDEAADAVVESVRTLIDTDATIYADLTAGADSRLVVAALSKLGALDRIGVQTLGDPDLPDVVGGARVAAFLGAHHRSGLPYPFSLEPFADRVRAHVETTSGMANVKKGMRERLDPTDEMRLSGQIGEVVSGWPTPVTRDKPAREVLAPIARAFQADCIALLRPEAHDQARNRMDDIVLEGDAGDLPGWFGAHRFYAHVRLRARMSRVDDLTSEVRAYPLYSSRLRDAGLAALWHHPDADLMALTAHRLAPGINDIDLTVAPVSATAAPAGRATTGADASFMRRAMASDADERQAFFASLINVDSAAWDQLDPDAYRSAAERYHELRHPQLRLLHGAANAILWLGDQLPR